MHTCNRDTSLRYPSLLYIKRMRSEFQMSSTHIILPVSLTEIVDLIFIAACILFLLGVCLTTTLSRWKPRNISSLFSPNTTDVQKAAMKKTNENTKSC